MELKCLKLLNKVYLPMSFNRTFMELKFLKLIEVHVPQQF